MSLSDKDQKKFFKYDLFGQPSSNRSQVWKDMLNDFFFEFNLSSQDDFRGGKLSGCYIGDLSVASIRSDAMSIHRTAKSISQDPLDYYFILLSQGGKISLTQRGREAQVGKGEFSLVSTSDPYDYIQNGNELFNNLIIPGDVVRNLSAHALDRVALPSRDDAVTRMFVDFANSFCQDIEEFDGHSELVLSRTLVDLLGLVLDGADYQSKSSSMKVAHRRRILQLIDRKFHDPSFDIQRISEALRISKRYIQEIFFEQGQTVSGVIRTRRIAEARRIIEAHRSVRISISSLAYKVGFSNLSHFSRVFKEETGFSPSEL